MFIVLGFRFIWNCVEDCWTGRFSVFVIWFSFTSLSRFTLKFVGFCTQNCTGCFQTKASCWGSWQRILFALSVSWLLNCFQPTPCPWGYCPVRFAMAESTGRWFIVREKYCLFIEILRLIRQANRATVKLDDRSLLFWCNAWNVPVVDIFLEWPALFRISLLP